jgi:hypothetical protein
MLFGMTPFTLVHTAISLLAILAGLVVMFGMLKGKTWSRWTILFLVATAATSLSGFLFIREQVMPSHVVGVMALIVLAVTLLALYRYHTAGAWREVYIIGATISLYLNIFVLIVQLFQKVPSLHELAPTQSELPFQLTQGGALSLFIVLGIMASVRFHPELKAARK